MKKIYYILFALLMISCKPRVFHSVTPAMEPTFPVGDRFILDYGEVSRNDVVMFSSPEIGPYVFFRMVAEPGDSLRMERGQLFVNGMKEESGKYNFGYFLETEHKLKPGFLKKYGISGNTHSVYGYYVHTTPKNAKLLSKVPLIDKVERADEAVDEQNPAVKNELGIINKDNIRPLYLPKAGDKIEGQALGVYQSTILQHEGVDIKGLEKYTFKKDYCFVMGDSRDNAMDSRYIGLIPIDKVHGKVINLTRLF